MNERVVFVGGVFDLFHIGHLNLLRRARGLGDRLIVGVLTDDAAAAYKPRPVVPFEERIQIVEACKYVDITLRQDHTDATRLLAKLKPDVLVHGDDHTPGWEIGQTWMRQHGRQFTLLPYTHGVSSTDIKERIRLL